MLQQIDEQKISDLAETFMKECFDPKSVKGMCFTICLPLSLHLHKKGIENFIEWGTFNNRPSHAWLILKDHPTIIIDPTMKQFCLFNLNDITDQKMRTFCESSQVLYIDEKPSHYIVACDYFTQKPKYNSDLNQLYNQVLNRLQTQQEFHDEEKMPVTIKEYTETVYKASLFNKGEKFCENSAPNLKEVIKSYHDLISKYKNIHGLN